MRVITLRGILAITPIFVLYEALKRKKYNGAVGKYLKSQYEVLI